MSKALLFLFCILYFLFHSPAMADIIHIPSDQPTIQVGINSAVDGDTVLIAEGTYHENINFRGKAITVASYFLMDGDTNHISQTIINGSQPSHPDSGSVVCFLYGEDTTSVLCGLTIREGTGTLINYSGTYHRQGGGVLCISSGARLVSNYINHNRIIATWSYGGGVSAENENTSLFIPLLILEENRISANFLQADSMAGSCGADIRGTSARIVKNIFETDTVIAAIHAFGGGVGFYGPLPTSPLPEALIQGNTFRANRVESTRSGALGGGIFIKGTGEVIVAENLFSENQVTSLLSWAAGGGLFIEDRNITGCGRKILQRNQIFNNQTHSQNGWGCGGGVLLNITLATLEENQVTDNVVTGGAGSAGGGIFIDSSSFRLENNLVTRNFSQTNGGGVEVGHLPQHGTEQLIANNIISHNYTNFSGGGLNIYEIGSIIIRKNRIHDNTAANETGGGICIGGSTFSALIENNIISDNLSRWGGGIGTWGNDILRFVNNTIAFNHSGEGGGGIIVFDNVNIMLMNNILWNNFPGGQIHNESSIPGQYHYNNIQGGWSGIGNIDIDPQFADTLFHLLPNSYCIGMGRSAITLGDSTYHAPIFDLEGNPRPNPIDTLVDIGALETSFPGRAQLVRSMINQGSGYIHPTQDSLRILLQILDPHQQGVTLTATMSNLQGAVWDEFPLFDDGQHGDSLAGDNLFGIVLPPVMLEDAFRFSYRLANSTFQDTMIFQGEQQITSIGPLVCEDYHILSQSGNRIQLELSLRNMGLQAAATEVRAVLIPLDSTVISILSNNQSFGSIPAGGKAVNSLAYIIDTIENPGTLLFNVRICMGGYPYWLQENLVVGIEPGSSQQPPGEFTLYQNYPNPFNPSTVISWQLAVGNFVQLSIYDLSGREVTLLVNRKQSAGSHQIEFDASALASGIYMYRLRTGTHVETKKMLLLR